MKLYIRKMLRNTTIGFKMTVVLVSVIIIPMLLLSYFSYSVVNARIIEDAKEKIDISLKRAWKEYARRGREMGLGMGQAAAGEVIRDIIKQRDREWAKRTLHRFEEARTYVDFWIITDKHGRVISRLNTEIHDDIIEINGLVSKAISSGNQIVSTEMLPEDFLKKEGFDSGYSVTAASGASAGEYKRPVNQTVENRALAVVVETPVFDEGRNIIGSIITGDILNNDNFVSNEMADVRRGLITTISMDGMRIATNMTGKNNKPAAGSMLPASVMAVVKSGRQVSGEIEMLGNKYISAFDSIKNNRGEIIGTLDVSMPVSSLLFVQEENRKIIGIVTIIGLVFAISAAFVLTRRITRPVRLIKEKAMAFAQGDLDAKINITTTENTRDEISILARTYNLMIDEVKNREKEKERSLIEMDKKNRELGDMTERLKATNEELEVSLEELQSQSEEVQSTNEELRILNEDMERKNTELFEANTIIKMEEEESKRAKDKLRHIYDTIRDYILLTDKDLNVIEANRSFNDDFRGGEPAVIGKTLCHLFGVTDSSKDCPAMFARTLQTGERYICNGNAEEVCPVKRSMTTGTPIEVEMDVQGRTLEWHSYPFSSNGAGSDMAVVYISDVTHQREIEHKLMQSDKLSAVGELVSGVAHELNNPLTAIMGYSELLQADSRDEGVRSRAEIILESSKRCKRIIDNLLTFSRWQKPEKRVEDINRLITNTLELKSYHMKVEDIDMDIHLDKSIPETIADGFQLQQVFLNMLNNAEHTIKEKGGKGRITVKSWREDDNIVVSFSDTGLGIPKEIIEKIFDPFFTTKEAGQGTGLGLSVSYGIIKEHNGDISVLSRKGEGTTFVIKLPVVAEACKSPEPIPAPVEEHAEVFKGKRTLILDDEKMILDFLKIVLLDLGFDVAATSNGHEAVEIVKAKDIDLIISDLKMPGMGGKQFYDAVNSVRPERANRIIFISGDTASSETQEFLKGTGNYFLKKPFTIDALKETISKIVS